jgi:hypothetical protein
MHFIGIKIGAIDVLASAVVMEFDEELVSSFIPRNSSALTKRSTMWRCRLVAGGDTNERQLEERLQLSSLTVVLLR